VLAVMVGRRAKTHNAPSTDLQTFPLNKLPPELREQIWQDCLPLARHPAEKSHLVPLRKFGPAFRGPFYGYRPSAVWSVCQESHAAVKRLERRCQGGQLVMERRSFQLAVLEGLKSAKTTESLLPLLDDGKYLGLALDQMLANNGRLLSRMTGNNHERMLELLLGASDFQIKLVVRRSFTCVVPYKWHPAVTEGWLGQTRLVSLSDTQTWAELDDIGVADGWHPSDRGQFSGFLGHRGIPDLALRRAMFSRALAPLVAMWEREDKSQREQGQEPLKPLPRMDVCVWVTITDESLVWSPYTPPPYPWDMVRS